MKRGHLYGKWKKENEIMCSFEIVYKHFNVPFQIQLWDIIAKIIIASI